MYVVVAGTNCHNSRLTSNKAAPYTTHTPTRASYTSHTVAAGALSVCISRKMAMMCCIIIVIEQRTGEAHPTAHHTAHTARSYCSSSRDSIAGAFVIIPPTPILITPPPGSCGTLSTNPGCPAAPTGYDAAGYAVAVAVANLPHSEHVIAIQISRLLEWG